MLPGSAESGGRYVTSIAYIRLMRKLRLAAVALLPAIALAGCATAVPFHAELEKTISQSEGGSFRLSDLADAEGTHFLVACPYESPSSIEARLGFAWADAPDYSAADDKQTVVITDGKTVVSRAELDRDSADFCVGDRWSLLPVDSVLRVTRTSDSLVVAAS